MSVQKTKPRSTRGKEAAKDLDAELPADLDFFKYAKPGAPKRKASDVSAAAEHGEISERKRRKLSEGTDEEESEESEDEGTPAEGPTSSNPIQRHKVTAKGSNVPSSAETFEELKQRYNLPPHLMANLKQYEYKHPTGIQSHGIPILLEVGRDPVLTRRYDEISLSVSGPCRNISDRYRENAVIPPPRHG